MDLTEALHLQVTLGARGYSLNIGLGAVVVLLLGEQWLEIGVTRWSH